MSGLDRVPRRPTSWRMGIARFLIILGIVVVVIGLAWPLLSKLGLGRLPGDIVVKRDNVTYYFPLVTSLLLSIVLSLLIGMFWR